MLCLVLIVDSISNSAWVNLVSLFQSQQIHRSTKRRVRLSSLIKSLALFLTLNTIKRCCVWAIVFLYLASSQWIYYDLWRKIWKKKERRKGSKEENKGWEKERNVVVVWREIGGGKEKATGKYRRVWLNHGSNKDQMDDLFHVPQGVLRI